jgi:peptidoglycan LD-endopeptidase LytH
MSLFLVCFLVVQSVPICQEFNALDIDIRDGAISKKEAEIRFRELIPKVAQRIKETPSPAEASQNWVFPLAGYSSKQIGGKKGSGYKPQGYNYFDGNKHLGHPAHDIFIYDQNQDGLDDRTNAPVCVLSATSGIVVALHSNWDSSSTIRGGNYIWIYDAAEDALFYYAHLSKLQVGIGQRLTAGDTLGNIGRTGQNAFKKRSPTHLHFSYLKLIDGLPQPVDFYKQLLSAKLIK